LLRRAACGVALDQVDLGKRRIALLAISKLSGQPHAIQHAFAARQLARLARGLPRACGFDDLRADDLGVTRILEQEVRQLRRYDLLDGWLYFRRDELVLRLRRELRLRHLD